MHSHYEEHFDKLRELIMIEIYWNPDRKITKQEFDNEPSWVVETKWKNLNNQLVNTCLHKHRPIELLLVHSQLECSNDAIQQWYRKDSRRGFNDWEYFGE